MCFLFFILECFFQLYLTSISRFAVVRWQLQIPTTAVNNISFKYIFLEPFYIVELIPNFRERGSKCIPIISTDRFLALLDSVSRGHGMGLLSFVCCPSIRPSMSQLFLNRMHGILSNFGCSFPWGIPQGKEQDFFEF